MKTSEAVTIFWVCHDCREGWRQRPEKCPRCGGDVGELRCHPAPKFGDSMRDNSAGAGRDPASPAEGT